MQKTGVRHNTGANYNFILTIIKKEEFGKRWIDKVKQSDAKCWLIKCRMAEVSFGIRNFRNFRNRILFCRI